MGMQQEILNEATRLFAAKGYEGTSLRDIAEAVGIRKPSLLYHFSSKAELRQAVLERLLAHWQDVLPKLLLAATSGLGRFDAFMAELVTFFTDSPDRARLLAREALDRPEALRASILAHVNPWVAAICDNIRAGQAQGMLHADVDPEGYVALVVALVISSVATFETLGVMLGARPTGAPTGTPSLALKPRQGTERAREPERELGPERAREPERELGPEREPEQEPTPPASAALARYVAEVLRVTRSSLFVERRHEPSETKR